MASLVFIIVLLLGSLCLVTFRARPKLRIARLNQHWRASLEDAKGEQLDGWLWRHQSCVLQGVITLTATGARLPVPSLERLLLPC